MSWVAKASGFENGIVTGASAGRICSSDAISGTTQNTDSPSNQRSPRRTVRASSSSRSVVLFISLLSFVLAMISSCASCRANGRMRLVRRTSRRTRSVLLQFPQDCRLTKVGRSSEQENATNCSEA